MSPFRFNLSAPGDRVKLPPWRACRRNEIAMVYQDPMAALNPSLKIGPQLTEVVVEHNGASREEARETCIRMLETGEKGHPPLGHFGTPTWLRRFEMERANHK